MQAGVLRLGWLAGCVAALLIAGCGSSPKKSTVPYASGSGALSLPAAKSGRGGYYKDDGPADQIPPGLENTPDAEPRVEPYATGTSRPYTVFGKSYTPITDHRPFKQRGIGSWYGKKFHGNKTANGEIYDMFKMTAAHPTLPIPSYARVTHLNNGRQIIVRINDRGPFHSDRIIDLSYTAALKLGYLGKGSGMLEVEHLLPDEIERLARKRRSPEFGTPPMALAAVRQPQQDAQLYPALPVELFAEKNAPLQSAPSSTGYYIQLGAFSQASNAEAMRAQYGFAWKDKLPPLAIVQNGIHYRLVAGPFDSREKAAEAAQQVSDSGVSRPIVVQRE